MSGAPLLDDSCAATFARNDRMLLPLGHGQTLVVPALGGDAVRVPERLASFLRGRGLRTQEEWAELLAPALARPAHRLRRLLWRVPALRHRVARALVQDLVHSGLMRASHDILAAAAAHPPPPPPEPIATVGMVTCDRAAALAAALESYLRNARDHGRRPAFVVMDDSRRRSSLESNRAAVERLRSGYGLHIAHFDRRWRARLGGRLTRLGFAPDVVAFALDGPPEARTLGANRNAFLLATAGRVAASFDDDTLCRTFTPGPPRGLALVGNLEDEWWFFADRQQALRHLPQVPGDVLALHEQLLGRPVRACIEAHGAEGLVSSDLDGALLHQVLKPESSVAFTMMGLVGDAAIWAPQYLTLAGPSRDRLVATEEAYDRAHRSREVVRLSPRLTVAPPAFCMAYGLGLDNRMPLPPFFPLFRNSDGVFGAALRVCAPQTFAGHLPWALAHVPDEERAFAATEAWRVPTAWRVSEVMTCALASVGPLPERLAPRDRMAAAGKHLAGLAGLDLEDFEAALLLEMRKRLAGRAARLDAALGRFGGRPARWAGDVRQALGALEKRMRQPSPVLPEDLEAQGGGGLEPRRRTRELVRSFGRLLQDWPAMHEAMRRINEEEGCEVNCRSRS